MSVLEHVNVLLILLFITKTTHTFLFLKLGFELTLSVSNLVINDKFNLDGLSLRKDVKLVGMFG